MSSARTSMFPSRSRAFRPAVSARTTQPSAMAMWISSPRPCRWSTPVFACWPMSWRISAIPKSSSVPVSAIVSPSPRAAERVSNGERPHEERRAAPPRRACPRAPTASAAAAGRTPRQNQTTNPRNRSAARSAAPRTGAPLQSWPAPPPTMGEGAGASASTRACLRTCASFRNRSRASTSPAPLERVHALPAPDLGRRPAAAARRAAAALAGEGRAEPAARARRAPRGARAARRRPTAARPLGIAPPIRASAQARTRSAAPSARASAVSRASGTGRSTTKRFAEKSSSEPCAREERAGLRAPPDRARPRSAPCRRCAGTASRGRSSRRRARGDRRRPGRWRRGTRPRALEVALEEERVPHVDRELGSALVRRGGRAVVAERRREVAAPLA